MRVSDPSCPFCAPEASRIFHAGSLTLGIWDGFAVSPGHALLIPKRHVASWFEASHEEQAELLVAIERAKEEVERSHQPDGYNIGINVGEAGGQTVSHLHVHLIPRYKGDVADPRGGVRFVIPEKANYLAPSQLPESSSKVAEAPTARGDFDWEKLGSDWPHDESLITGDGDPLLPHIRKHLDQAGSADFAVAFLQRSGVQLIFEHLRDLLDRGGQLRLVTGDYLGVTDPDALTRLLDLQAEHPAHFELRVFESGGQSYHPKAYIFHPPPDRPGAGVALVGSSNLSRSALTNGVEWNFRTIPARDETGFPDVTRAFERLRQHSKVVDIDANWIGAYRKRQRPKPIEAEVEPDEPLEVPEPHDIQKRALAALEATRRAGNTAALVVLATGLGKTWLSAFDNDREGFTRVLFVAHREEILRQARSTYRCIRPTAHLGYYNGQEKAPDADIVFASIQTLGRQTHLDRFGRTEFDYIVIDEFHHADAKTYRRLINYFEPRFLLGLTATPERTDGGDLLALCQENLAFSCGVAEGIRAELLAPFHYYGVPDEVDYSNIPWRSRKFDETALTNAVATQSRAQNALDQYRQRGGKRTLSFCCSVRHADFMADFFSNEGVRTAVVHSGPGSDPRAGSLEKLEAGELDVVFAVDMFNEGVDLPSIDTVMMLRPTESRIIWLQQFGRGLRVADEKDHLTVIDYIGNHRTFLLKPQTLFELPGGDANVAQMLERLERGEMEMPPGCEVTYDLEAVEILKGLLRTSTGDDAIRLFYEDFRERHGMRPTATEMHHEGYRPLALRRGFGSWFGFVGSMGDLGEQEKAIATDTRTNKFLTALETTAMTRSYKMLVLLAMVQAGRMPGEIRIAELAEQVRHLARRSAVLQADLGVSLDDRAGLEDKLVENPIRAWTGGRGTEGTSYFEYQDGVFRLTLNVDTARAEAFAELVRELAEWRLAVYLDRAVEHVVPETEVGVRCRVSHSGGKPILFLPSREKNASIPEGWTPVEIEGEAYEANFVKVAVNVVRRVGETGNVLPEIARRWFGEHAGLPGTGHEVRFVEGDEGWRLEAVARRENGGALQVGRSYMRADIPAQFGLEFHRTVWEQGFVTQGGAIFLLVTLNKAQMPENHRYSDRFLSRSLFEWKSQNRTSQEGTGGEAI
jgi:superfamily II DNA or RNA helicase/diadenosine tetraphosphate (Ap4A) HIT family hydrolase